MTTNKNRKRSKLFSAVLLLLGFSSTLFLSLCWENLKAQTSSRASAIQAPIQLAQTTTTTTYYVSTTGNNSNPGTSDRPWRTISYAVSAQSPVQPGNTILVQPGTYTELITLGKSGNSQAGHIRLKANGTIGSVKLRDPDSINGGFGEGVIQSISKGYWIIDGFRVENTSWAGIALRDANDMIVQNNYTYQTGASGIIILPGYYYDGGEAEVTSRNVKVLNNTVQRANWRWLGNSYSVGTQEALSIWGVNGFEVANNFLTEGNREGIDIKVGSRNGSVHHNRVTRQALVSGTSNGYRGGPAIYVDGNRAAISNVDIYSNVVYNNTADAIAIADEVPEIGDVSNIRIYNNVIYGNGRLGMNGGTGISVNKNVRNVDIIHNTIVKNVQSIVIDGAAGDGTQGYRTRNILVRNNIFANNSYRNGFIQFVDNLTFDCNLFTNQFANFYDGGNNISNLFSASNTKVPSLNFRNFTNNDFHLTSTSPAINLGSIYIGTYAQLDKDGVRRNMVAGPDVGAYEY